MSGVRQGLHARTSARRTHGVFRRRLRRVLQLRPLPRYRSERRMSTLACPTPIITHDRVQLGHGSGGKMSAALLKERFLPHFANEVLAQLGDAAVVDVNGTEVAISTDTFVVNPLEFPGGNIGSLAGHGTVNDLAMMGARPVYLSAGFILEEGLSFDLLDRIVRSMGE